VFRGEKEGAMAKPQCEPKADASDLVMTQAELPPGIDAPTPKAEHDRILADSDVPADVERDIHRLAERVGGLYRLREVIDNMCGAAE
jgi:hypothetical protein